MTFAGTWWECVQVESDAFSWQGRVSISRVSQVDVVGKRGVEEREMALGRSFFILGWDDWW